MYSINAEYFNVPLSESKHKHTHEFDEIGRKKNQYICLTYQCLVKPYSYYEYIG